jgi:hypothetical protein
VLSGTWVTGRSGRNDLLPISLEQTIKDMVETKGIEPSTFALRSPPEPQRTRIYAKRRGATLAVATSAARNTRGGENHGGNEEVCKEKVGEEVR